MNHLFLSAVDITKRFSGSVDLFECISLYIQKGDAISLVGANGSGKSTLLQILAGLEEPTAGKVQRSDSLVKIAYLPQNTPETLLPLRTLDVINNFVKKPLNDLQLKYIEKFELSALLSHPFKSLSLGQKRKALILRNLDESYDLMFFDEPFASLDHTSQQTLVELFRELRDRHRTFLTILHEHHLNLDFFNKHIHLKKCCQ